MQDVDMAGKLRNFFAKGGSLRMLNDIPQEDLSNLYAYASELQKKGDLAAARNIFFLLVYCDHWSADYLLGMAIISQDLGAHEDAIIYLAQATSVLITDPRPLWLTGKSMMALGMWEDAKLAFENALLLINNSQEWDLIKNYCEKQMVLCKTKLKIED